MNLNSHFFNLDSIDFLDSIESCVVDFYEIPASAGMTKVGLDSIESICNSPHFMRDSSLRASHYALNDGWGFVILSEAAPPVILSEAVGAAKNLISQ